MKPQNDSRFQILYGSVAACGMAVVALGLYRVIHDQTPAAWIGLALLAAIAGSFSLKIPGVNGRVSACDTIICLSILIFGPYCGAISAAVDAVVGSMRCKTSSQRLRFAIYNAGSSALSAFAVGQVLRRLPGASTTHPQVLLSESLLLALCVMAGVYFLINTGLVAAAVALEKSLNFIEVWQKGFMWTCANYVVGAFVAGVLAQLAGSLSPGKLAAILFSCLAVYISCRGYVRIAKAAEAQASLTKAA